MRCVLCAHLQGDHPEGHTPLWERERVEPLNEVNSILHIVLE